MAALFTDDERKRKLNPHKIETHDYGDFSTKTIGLAVAGVAVGITALVMAYQGYQQLFPIVQDYFSPTQPQIQELGTDLEDKAEDPRI